MQERALGPASPAVTAKHTDAINPAHYKTAAGMQAIDVQEAFELNLHLGNAIKYILRCGKKGDAVEDLRKAIWWLEREIARRDK